MPIPKLPRVPSKDPREPDRIGLRGAALLGWAVVGLLVVVVGGAIGVGAFKASPPGEVCVVQEGGPFDGRGVKEVRQPGEGIKLIGAFNKQRCFPATERNYIVSADANEGDRGTADFVEVPTADAVSVRIEGQALFRLTTEAKLIADFYRRYGLRTFQGVRPYDGDAGWRAFLAVQFRPILDNALREAIGSFRCVQLNNTCQYVLDAEQAVSGRVEAVNNNQTLTVAQDRIARTLANDLNKTLGGRFFEGVQFRLRGVTFDPEVRKQIVAAQAKRTQVATAKLDAQRRVEQARGDRRVAQERAEAIRSTRSAYAGNPSQARIDALRALPRGLQALGGDTSTLLGPRSGG